MATVLVLNVKDNTVYPTEVNDLDDYYKHLDADVFDIASRKIGDKYYDIFVDDIGFFRDDVKISAVNADDLSPMLVGNLIFANHDSQGNTTSLSDDDVLNICTNMLLVGYEDGSLGTVVKVSY